LLSVGCDRKLTCLCSRVASQIFQSPDRVSSLAIEISRLELLYGRTCRRQDSPPSCCPAMSGGRARRNPGQCLSCLPQELRSMAMDGHGGVLPMVKSCTGTRRVAAHAAAAITSLLGIAGLVLPRPLLIGLTSCQGRHDRD
jgi:hypothetical protein